MTKYHMFVYCFFFILLGGFCIVYMHIMCSVQKDMVHIVYKVTLIYGFFRLSRAAHEMLVGQRVI